jgi:hypothetical protein
MNERLFGRRDWLHHLPLCPCNQEPFFATVERTGGNGGCMPQMPSGSGTVRTTEREYFPSSPLKLCEGSVGRSRSKPSWPGAIEPRPYCGCRGRYRSKSCGSVFITHFVCSDKQNLKVCHCEFRRLTSSLACLDQKPRGSRRR